MPSDQQKHNMFSVRTKIECLKSKVQKLIIISVIGAPDAENAWTRVMFHPPSKLRENKTKFPPTHQQYSISTVINKSTQSC